MLKAPSRVFSFADWARMRPREAIPGDRLDLQFTELINAIRSCQQAIADIRADDGKLKRGIVADDNLIPRLRDGLLSDLHAALEPLRSSARGLLTSTIASEHQAELYAKDAERAAFVASQLATGMEATRALAARAADDASRVSVRAAANAIDADNSANDAAAQADNAELAANLALQWAEYLAGPVVDATHAPAYIAGSPFPHGLYYQPVEGGLAGLWSAKWWALYAQTLVGKGAYYYLGAWSNPPVPGAVNPITGQTVPNPLAPGSMYYDLATNSLYAWNGSTWTQQQMLTASYTSTFLYTATAGQTAFSGPDSGGHTPNVGASPSLVYVNGVRLTTSDYAINASTSTLTIVDPLRAGDQVQWDLLVPQSQLAPGAVNVYKLQNLIPDGATTDFPITYLDPVSGLTTNAVVNNSTQLVVSVDGVAQEPGGDYTTSTTGGASTLHMSSAPAADAHFWAVWMQAGGASSFSNTTPFTIPGAATARSLNTRFGEVFNVKDYGAVGDSNANGSVGTDNQSAFTAAINALIAAGGGTLYIPAGIYLLNSAVSIDSAVTMSMRIVGEREATTIVGSFNGYLLDRNPTTAHYGVFYFIEYINFMQHDPTPITSGCIRMLGVDVGSIKGCHIQMNGGIGICLGWDTQPPTATFSASSSNSTTMTISAVTGTISAAHGGIYFPVPMSGPNLPGNALLVAQQSGAPGGAGVYTTQSPTTTTGAGYQTNPNQPSQFDTFIESCMVNGGGAFNVDPAQSYRGIGIQLSNHNVLRNCAVVNCQTGCQMYGAWATVEYCRFESNSWGIVMGRDPFGQDWTVTNGLIAACSMESNYVAILLRDSSSSVIERVSIQGNRDDINHNSARGIDAFSAGGMTIRNCIISSSSPYFSDAGIYLSGQCWNLVFEDCVGDQHAPWGVAPGNLNYWISVRGRCVYFPTLSDTLAHWSQLATTYNNPPVIGEHVLISDASLALGSQPYGAAVVGGGANLARAWWDGTTYRYG